MLLVSVTSESCGFQQIFRRLTERPSESGMCAPLPRADGTHCTGVRSSPMSGAKDVHKKTVYADRGPTNLAPIDGPQYTIQPIAEKTVYLLGFTDVQFFQTKPKMGVYGHFPVHPFVR